MIVGVGKGSGSGVAMYVEGVQTLPSDRSGGGEPQIPLDRPISTLWMSMCTRSDWQEPLIVIRFELAIITPVRSSLFLPYGKTKQNKMTNKIIDRVYLPYRQSCN